MNLNNWKIIICRCLCWRFVSIDWVCKMYIDLTQYKNGSNLYYERNSITLFQSITHSPYSFRNKLKYLSLCSMRQLYMPRVLNLWFDCLEIVCEISFIVHIYLAFLRIIRDRVLFKINFYTVQHDFFWKWCLVGFFRGEREGCLMGFKSRFQLEKSPSKHS